MNEPAAASSAGSSNTVRLCAANDLADGTARRFDVEGHRIALVRIADDFFAIGDRCSHANYSLADGWVWAEECELECPQHSSTFNLRTGEPTVLPATEPVPTYEVQRDGDDVLVVLP